MYRFFASNDTERYRRGYPGKRDDPRLSKNLDFYSNRVSSVPQGDTIENIHKKWRGDYDLLEIHHGYIQWLFPIREDGLNMHAQELQLHEAQAIQRDPRLQNRIVESYSLMLDFYGFDLLDRRSGAVRRSRKHVSRFRNLVNHPHNFLRITRILKCLGEMGLEHMKVRWLHELILEAASREFLLRETLDSLKNYWIETVKDDRIREEMQTFLYDMYKANMRGKKRQSTASTAATPASPGMLPGCCACGGDTTVKEADPPREELACPLPSYAKEWEGGVEGSSGEQEGGVGGHSFPLVADGLRVYLHGFEVKVKDDVRIDIQTAGGTFVDANDVVTEVVGELRQRRAAPRVAGNKSGREELVPVTDGTEPFVMVLFKARNVEVERLGAITQAVCKHATQQGLDITPPQLLLEERLLGFVRSEWFEQSLAEGKRLPLEGHVFPAEAILSSITAGKEADE